MYNWLMIDAIIFVLLVNAGWIRTYSYVAWSGYPLMFSVLGTLWYTGCLPATAYIHEVAPGTVAVEFCALLVGTEAAQTTLHRLLHTSLKHTPIGRAHSRHHTHRHPEPQDAFYTGALDALVQLVVPVVALIWILRPHRLSLALFGAFYSFWLHLLHSDWDVPALAHLGLVDPEYHRVHHRRTNVHFSNVFRID